MTWQVDQLASTINDWIEGARRLTADDAASWEAATARGTTTGRGVAASARAVSSAAAAAEAAEAAAAARLVGSYERVLEIQAECLADDLAVNAQMAAWTEARLREYFESGGASEAPAEL